MKILRKLLYCTTAITFITTSCSIPNNILNSGTDNKNQNFDKSLVRKTDFKTKAVEPQLLNFESKVPNQSFSVTQNLPSGNFNEFSLKVTGNTRNAIKIPANGNFNLIIQSGSNFQIIDNDANDGTAVIQMPQGFSEGFATITRDASGKQTGSINIKDDLYYVNQDLKELETSNKGGANNLTGDYWYQLKKRVFPLTQNWGNPNGTNHVFKFTNNGIKQILFRWYNTNAVDYPLGVNEIGVNGGNVDLPNVGKLEIPQGALNQNTIISLRQQLSSYDILDFQGNKAFDYASPVVKAEPINLSLTQKAKLYLQTDMLRVGNNAPQVLATFNSDDLKLWDKLKYEQEIINIDYNSPVLIDNLSYFSKQILSFIKPTDNKHFRTIPMEDVILDEIPAEESNNSFTTQSVTTQTKYYTLVDDNGLSASESKELEDRFRNAYTYFKKVTSDDPITKQDITIYMNQNNEPFTSTFGNIKLYDSNSSIEHELWHIFQFSMKNFSKIYPSTIYFNGKKWWIHESSAEYMGASAFKKYTSKFSSSEQIKINYQTKLKDSLLEVGKEYPYSDYYYGVGYLTYLANINGTTGLSQDIVMKDIVDTIDNKMDKFHDYALHAYYEDKFHLYYPYDERTQDTIR